MSFIAKYHLSTTCLIRYARHVKTAVYQMIATRTIVTIRFLFGVENMWIIQSVDNVDASCPICGNELQYNNELADMCYTFQCKNKECGLQLLFPKYKLKSMENCVERLKRISMRINE